MIRLLLMISSLIGGFANAAEIKIWVGTSVYQNIFSKIGVPFEKETGIKLVYVNDMDKVGASTANIPASQYFEDVIDGKAEAATTSLGYEDWVELLKKKGREIPKEITNRVIGRDLMVIFGSKKITLSELNMEQIESLYTGKVQNWKELGGPDLPVTLVMAPNKPATNAGFKKAALKDKEFKGKIVETDNYDNMYLVIEKTPGALGFGPSGLGQNDKVKLFKIPSIGRPATFVTKGKPSENVKKLLDFIRDNGKKYGVGG